MRLRKLKNGTQICPEIRLDSLLDTHHGIALYLATDKEYGHALVHVLPDFEGESLTKLETAAEFYTKILNQKARCGRHEEFLFFSEPFPLGEFMFEWLERRGRIGLAEALKRIIGLLKVLDQAREKGIYHGRITPKMILMERTGETIDLRLMGLGVANAMTDSMQCDIDWFDYTFDLEGMTPVAVDIYGIAIILMGLVSGESGIDNFEATGLLPPMFRGGMLQQVMEKALALRMDAYADILTFSLDLEAAMLEVDERRGEVYVADLVGFESAVKSITHVSEENAITENSGVWNSLFDTLEQEERSSLLYSLTSLPSIRSIDDEDEDVTKITSMPNAVLGTRRIRSAHADKTNVGPAPEKIEHDKTEIIARPQLATLEEAAKAEQENAKASETSTENASEDKPQSVLSTAEQKLADIQSLEDELEDASEEEDDAPTRVMMRPNYFSVQFEQESHDVDVPGEEATEQPEEVAANSMAGMKIRLQNAEVTEQTLEICKDVTYAEDDETAFPPENENIVKQPKTDHPAQNEVKPAAHKTPQTAPHQPKTTQQKFSYKQRTILIVLLCIVAVLFVLTIWAWVSKSSDDQTVDSPRNETIEPSGETTENQDDGFVIVEPLPES